MVNSNTTRPILRWLKPGLLLTALLLTGGCRSVANTHPTPLPPPNLAEHARVPCRVLLLYDGDTLGCDLNHNGHIDSAAERIRLLGIDAPEMHYSRKNRSGQNEPYAQAAMDFLAKNVHQRTVYLAYDITEFDRYGRRLAYVYTTPDTTTSINEALLSQGLALTLFLGQNRRLQLSFEQAQTLARKHQKGLWKP
ncbi:MAG: thermonuclease family protein [Candidatus Melainabacteria bacterium]|nr:thermonuclease family protein [Candidatus Melainabacteria bacterium]